MDGILRKGNVSIAQVPAPGGDGTAVHGRGVEEENRIHEALIVRREHGLWQRIHLYRMHNGTCTTVRIGHRHRIDACVAHIDRGAGSTIAPLVRSATETGIKGGGLPLTNRYRSAVADDLPSYCYLCGNRSLASELIGYGHLVNTLGIHLQCSCCIAHIPLVRGSGTWVESGIHAAANEHGSRKAHHRIRVHRHIDEGRRLAAVGIDDIDGVCGRYIRRNTDGIVDVAGGIPAIPYSTTGDECRRISLANTHVRAHRRYR